MSSYVFSLRVLTYVCLSKLWTSEMSRTTSSVYVSRVSYLFECNANDTYVLRMTNVMLLCFCGFLPPAAFLHFVEPSLFLFTSSRTEEDDVDDVTSVSALDVVEVPCLCRPSVPFLVFTCQESS